MRMVIVRVSTRIANVFAKSTFVKISLRFGFEFSCVR